MSALGKQGTSSGGMGGEKAGGGGGSGPDRRFSTFQVSGGKNTANRTGVIVMKNI